MLSAIAWPAAARELPDEKMMHRGVLEREAKFAVSDLAAIDVRLRARAGPGARFLATVRERNYVLDTARDELKARDERLRIREIEGRPGVQITWKGLASVYRGVRRRQEREFHADDREACVAVLANLGLRPVRSYEKVRSSWRLNDVIVCLDELPFGAFVEIEFTPEVSQRGEAAALARAVALLGLRQAPRVHASYARLQQEWDERKTRR